MFQVEADILAFVMVDVDSHFLGQMDRLAIGRLETLQIGPNNVLCFAGREALLELPMMVGIDFPADFLGFVGGFTNLDSDAVDGQVVWAPHGSYNQGVRFA